MMTRAAISRSLITLMILTMGAVAQEQPPQGPFKTVHLVTLDASQEAKLSRTLAQFNQAMAKAGYPNARYRLYRVAGKQQGPHTHLWEASWSGRSDYEKIHNLPAYQEASALLEEVTALMKDEVYNRFVEIPTKR
jgi:hypothetical protein